MLGKIKSVGISLEDDLFSIDFVIKGHDDVSGEAWYVPYHSACTIPLNPSSIKTSLDYVLDLMKQARVSNIKQLKNKPVEFDFVNEEVIWMRILTEII